MESMKTVTEQLFALQDKDYREFHKRLVPTVDPDAIIGVRTPALRKFAKKIAKMPEEASGFMEALPHLYYEENNLHAFLIEQLGDFETCIKALDRFLPYVDNWATCDQMTPKVFKQNLPGLRLEIQRWLASDRTYTIRFAIRMLMEFYLDGLFSPEYPEMVARLHSEEYYVRMMAAWYFATALAKQYDAVLPYIENRVLEPWTHNKAIQKSVESFRLTSEQKEYLKTLRIKRGGKR